MLGHRTPARVRQQATTNALWSLCDATQTTFQTGPSANHQWTAPLGGPSSHRLFDAHFRYCYTRLASEGGDGERANPASDRTPPGRRRGGRGAPRLAGRPRYCAACSDHRPRQRGCAGIPDDRRARPQGCACANGLMGNRPRLSLLRLNNPRPRQRSLPRFNSSWACKVWINYIYAF